MSQETEPLRELATSYGVQLAYRNVHGRRQAASTATLLGVLDALGVPLAGPQDAAQALKLRRLELQRRAIEPVTVAWDGSVAKLPLRSSAWARCEGQLVQCVCDLEGGESIHWTGEVAVEQRSGRRGRSAGTFAHVIASQQAAVPLGYHRLYVEGAEFGGETFLIAAPSRSYSVPHAYGPQWGLFAPLYALHSDQSWGAGNYSDLEKFCHWTAQQGGNMVATLPMLAAYLDEPYEDSPYAPLSRLFWNEFYVDVRRVAEFQKSPQAQDIVNSPGFQRELQLLREQPRVNYRRQYRLLREVLNSLCRTLLAQGGSRREDLEQFLRDRPDVTDYAAFRSVVDRQQSEWTQWPDDLKSRALRAADYDAENCQTYIYAQWLAEQQLQRVSERTKDRGTGLYLDLPLGVHRGGYDTWRHRDVFAMGASGGAPPDLFFAAGQNWGFPPLHPERIREQGYAYLIAVLRQHLRYAGLLRIDHVMQFHRLYWIPDQFKATHGAYVRYPAEELYAIVCLESVRHRCRVAGENLGTVPGYVDSDMKRHSLRPLFVAQYELGATDDPPLPRPPSRCVASVNTHDMASFASFGEGLDLKLLHSLGVLDDSALTERVPARMEDLRALARYLHQEGWCAADAEQRLDELRDAVHAWLAASRAELVLINLEDMWLETEPQNVPGTGSDRPNWCRKVRFSLEQLTQSDALQERLRGMTRIRRTRAGVGP